MMKKILAVPALMVVASQAAASNLPLDYQTSVDTVSADIATVGGSLVALAIVALGFKWIKGTIFS